MEDVLNAYLAGAGLASANIALLQIEQMVIDARRAPIPIPPPQLIGRHQPCST